MGVNVYPPNSPGRTAIAPLAAGYINVTNIAPLQLHREGTSVTLYGMFQNSNAYSGVISNGFTIPLGFRPKSLQSLISTFIILGVAQSRLDLWSDGTTTMHVGVSTPAGSVHSFYMGWETGDA